MVFVISTLVVFILVLAVLFGGLCTATGQSDKGNQILADCITAFVLYFLVIQLFCIGNPGNGVFASGIPLIRGIEQNGGMKNFMWNQPGQFAMDFVELVTLTLLLHWISNLLSFGEAGLVGKLISRVILVFLGILLYGIVMDSIRENPVIKWCVYCVECVLTGTSILYTPALMISAVLGLKRKNQIVTYLLAQLPKTSIGKAITTAITTSVFFIAFFIVLENQYGSVCDILTGMEGLMEASGAVVVMAMGIYFMVSSVKARAK